MRFTENNLIAEAYAKVLQEAKMKPSAGLTKKQKSNVAKKARAGKDIGKKGPGFAKMAKAAGGGEKGKKIAAAAMWKSVKRESAGILAAYKGKELLSESVSSEQYDEIVSIIHSAIAKAKLSKPELSNEIEQVWDVVSDLWADHEMRVYNALMIDQIPEEDQMIPKVEKILQKMTKDLGSEDLAVEALSKWDEDEMNEYYNNHLMGEEKTDKVTLTFTDDDGEWHSVPLEYNNELTTDSGGGMRFTASTDIFGLLDKDSLQNVFVEVVVE
jgi:hypothetical protein